MPIQRLSPQLASQIAAGEVIERPASVLKEVLENSIDAGSRHIEVRIVKSGVQQIYVQDNGTGIALADFPLVFCPHATSKITAISDLEKLHSYGFRGEALASIASVAKVTLTARTADDKTGHRLLANFEAKTPTIIPVPHAIGTTVDIQELFYNTPARRKFLKSDKTEWLHLEQVFKNAALSCPHISFTLFHQGKVVYRLPSCTDKPMHLSRIKQFSGTTFVNEAIELACVNADLRLWGWIAPPNPLQKTGPLHYFFINGRAIKDKVVTHALQQAFLSVFPNTPYPLMAYVLYFDLDPEQIDVNVHPAKQEVRFREPRRVHAFLAQALESAFTQAQPENLVRPLDAISPRPTFAQSCDKITASPVYVPPLPAAIPPFTSSKPKGIAASRHQYLSSPKASVTLGEPLCIIRQKWLLSDNGSDLFLTDIALAHRAISGEVIDTRFFSLADGHTLLCRLSSLAQANHLSLDAITQRCPCPPLDFAVLTTE